MVSGDSALGCSGYSRDLTRCQIHLRRRMEASVWNPSLLCFWEFNEGPASSLVFKPKETARKCIIQGLREIHFRVCTLQAPDVTKASFDSMIIGHLGPSLRLIRWILNLLHDAKYIIPWEAWYYSIVRSCRILIST